MKSAFLCKLHLLLIAVAGFTAIYFLSCENVIRDLPENSFIVRFNLDGIYYEWRSGIRIGPEPDYLEFSGEACGFIHQDAGAGEFIIIIASDFHIDFSIGNPGTYISIVIPATGVTADISGGQPTRITIGGGLAWNADTLSTVSITDFEQVGGVIKGFFSGTDISDRVVTDGYFEVRRFIDYAAILVI